MNDTPTPRTDETEKIADKLGSPAASYGFALARLKETELELTAAREELRRTDFALSQASIIYDVVVEQRDRLAEALERIAEYQGVDDEDPKTMAIEALQSLNQAAVEGGADE